MTYIAVIPARGGSKGVKNKNLQLVGGLSLVARAIISAQKTKKISKIIVSTDSEVIAKEAIKYGAEIHLRRPETASDNAKTIDVLKDVFVDLNLIGEVCILLQPTSPLREAEHISKCLNVYERMDKRGSVITATVCEHHPYKMVVKDYNDHYVPIRDLSDLETPRQKLPQALRINGAVYIISFNELIDNESFFVQPIQFIEMEESASIDIDSYDDLAKANLIIEGKKHET